ncbi:hypothetical protein ACTD5D_40075 [Nocardia takedensis]|uniref:hypothetical protein n=1 Tax=Nocardia takedensis TaxID=259390 RepID=UPI003F775BAD
MNKRRGLVVAALPVVAALGIGGAQAAPQPGLAAPGEGQPGLSANPAPPPEQPTIVDAVIPDPPRPRPAQQTQPQVQTVIQPQAAPPPVVQESVPDLEDGTEDETEAQPPEETPEQPLEQAPPGPQPRWLRFGTELIAVPDWVGPDAQAVVQDLADKAEWWAAAGFDALGIPQDQSDRRAAATMVGGVAGWNVGADAGGAVGGLTGCFGGLALGGVVGGVIGGASSGGVAAPLGAFVGGLAGCVGGALLIGVPAYIGGGVVGAGVGSAAAAALGTGTNLPPQAPSQEPAPEASTEEPAVADEPAAESGCGQSVEPVAEAIADSAPEPVAVQVDPVVASAAAVVDQVEASGPVGVAVVNSLRDAVEALPLLAPHVPFADPINGLIDAARTALEPAG